VVSRRRISKEMCDLIFRMLAENPTWGAPRIHGKLMMFGYDVSERTVSRWMRRAQRDPEPAKRWLAFLHNHRQAIVAMDFFTVPTIKFSVLCCLIFISHESAAALHCRHQLFWKPPTGPSPRTDSANLCGLESRRVRRRSSGSRENRG